MVIYLGKARFVTLSLLLQNCFLITSLLIALSCHNKLQKQVARLIITGFVLVTLRAQQGHGCSLSVAGRLVLQTPPGEKRRGSSLRGGCAYPALSRKLLLPTLGDARALLEPESLKFSPPSLNPTGLSIPIQMPSRLWLKSFSPFFAIQSSQFVPSVTKACWITTRCHAQC